MTKRENCLMPDVPNVNALVEAEGDLSTMAGNVELGLVSIIMPCYNASLYLREAIDSVLNQSYEHFELIVVDDGSTDESLEIIKSYGDKIQWESGPNQGACAARNRGFKQSKGEYIKFFDADDTLLPQAVELQVAQMKELPNHAIPYGMGLDFFTGEEAGNNYVKTNINMSKDDMIYECYSKNIATPTPLHRRNLLLNHERGFDTRIKQGQEWTFHLNLAMDGVKFVYYPTPIYRWRESDSPDRITNRHYNKTTYDITIASRVLNAKLVDNYYGDKLPFRMKEAIYAWLMMDVRDLIRKGLDDDAKNVLHFGKKWAVNTPKIGGYPFRICRLIFGAIVAEKIRISVKSLIPVQRKS